MSMGDSRLEEHQWKRDVAENIDKGESIYAVYRGEALQRLSGRMTDREALALGHFDGITNITLSSIIATEMALNKFSTLEHELVPMVKRIKKADRKKTDIIHSIGSFMKVWVIDDNEAKILGEESNYKVKKVQGKYYYEYPGFKSEDFIMTEFAHNIARASGSLRGETKIKGLETLATAPVVPNFSQQFPTGTWNSPAEMNVDDDDEE